MAGPGRRNAKHIARALAETTLRQRFFPEYARRKMLVRGLPGGLGGRLGWITADIPGLPFGIRDQRGGAQWALGT